MNMMLRRYTLTGVPQMAVFFVFCWGEGDEKAEQSR